MSIHDDFPEIDFDLDAAGDNTLFEYGYADGSNYKVHSEVVLSGRLTEEQIRNMLSSLDQGEFFIPSQVGLRDLQGDFIHGSAWDDDDDHVWHRIEGIKNTNAPASDVSVETLIESWPKDQRDWDMLGATEKHTGAGYGI